MLTLVMLVKAQIPLRIFESVGWQDNGRQFYTSISTDVITDQVGRVWYGTIGSGMIRYDGYNYKQFQYDWQDSTTISGNRVVKLLEDTDGNIWSVSYTGVDRLNVRTGKFTRFGRPPNTKRVNAIQQVTATTFLVGTDEGLWELDANTHKFVAWTPKVGVAVPSRILDFHRDQSGQLRAASTTGILLLYPNEKSFDVIKVSSSKEPGCLKIFQSKQGTFWILTASGLLRYVAENHKFEYAGLPDSISTFALEAAFPLVPKQVSS
jgi:ligand-binding sensor domain-containing protein